VISGRISRSPETIKGVTKRRERDSSNEAGKTNKMEATEECTSLWQQDMEHGLNPLVPWCSQVIGVS